MQVRESVELLVKKLIAESSTNFVTYSKIAEYTERSKRKALPRTSDDVIESVIVKGLRAVIGDVDRRLSSAIVEYQTRNRATLAQAEKFFGIGGTRINVTDGYTLAEEEVEAPAQAAEPVEVPLATEQAAAKIVAGFEHKSNGSVSA
jgi:hypothetical protein